MYIISHVRTDHLKVISNSSISDQSSALYQGAAQLVDAMAGTDGCRFACPFDHSGIVVGVSARIVTHLDSRPVPLVLAAVISREEAPSLTIPEIKVIHEQLEELTGDYETILDIPNLPPAAFKGKRIQDKEAPLSVGLVKALAEEAFGGSAVYCKATASAAYKLLMGCPNAMLHDTSWCIGLPVTSGNCIRWAFDLTFVQEQEFQQLGKVSGLPPGRRLLVHQLPDRDLDERTKQLIKLLRKYPDVPVQAQNTGQLLDALRQHHQAVHPAPALPVAKEPQSNKQVPTGKAKTGKGGKYSALKAPAETTAGARAFPWRKLLGLVIASALICLGLSLAATASLSESTLTVSIAPGTLLSYFLTALGGAVAGAVCARAVVPVKHKKVTNI